MRWGKAAIWKSHMDNGSWYWTECPGWTGAANGGWEPTWVDAVNALERALTTRRQAVNMESSASREKE